MSWIHDSDRHPHEATGDHAGWPAALRDVRICGRMAISLDEMLSHATGRIALFSRPLRARRQRWTADPNRLPPTVWRRGPVRVTFACTYALHAPMLRRLDGTLSPLAQARAMDGPATPPS